MNDEPKAPAKPKTKKSRRNYASELSDLQGRVDAALRLLSKCGGKSPDTAGELIMAACETLIGK